MISYADLKFAQRAKPGDYLHKWYTNRFGQRLKGTGGRSDGEIAAIRAELRKRDMVLETDEAGWVVAR